MTQSEADKSPYRSLTLTSLFDDRGVAAQAVESLRAAGIPQASISLIAEAENATENADEKHGPSHKLEDFLFPEADHAIYSEGIRRGGHVLTVRGLAPDRHELALGILEDAGAVDLDERIETWRSEGWSDTQAYLDELQEPPTVIDGDVAASLIGKGRGNEVVPVITEKLKFGKASDGSRPRVRIYTVEYALKSPDDRKGSSPR